MLVRKDFSKRNSGFLLTRGGVVDDGYNDDDNDDGVVVRMREGKRVEVIFMFFINTPRYGQA